jgi:hypothetical protein
MILIIHAYFLITFEIFATNRDGTGCFSTAIRLKVIGIYKKGASFAQLRYRGVRCDETFGGFARRLLWVRGFSVVSFVKISSSYHL